MTTLRHTRFVQLYIALAALYILAGLIGFVPILASLGQPFGGFIWQYGDPEGFFVNYDVPRHWPGPQAGLMPYTTILRINGAPPSAFTEIYASARIGERIAYDVLTPDGERQTITVAVERFNVSYLLDAYAPVLGAGLAFMGAGYVLLRSARNAGRVLLAFILLVGSAPAFHHSNDGYIATFATAAVNRWSLAMIWTPTIALIGALLCHAALIYPRMLPSVARHRRLVPLIYGVGAVLALALALTILFGMDARIARVQDGVLTICMGYIALGLVATLARGVWVLVQPHSLAIAEYRQMRILAVAWGGVVLVFAVTVLATLFKLRLPFEIFVLLAITLPIGLVYAIRNADMIEDLESENARRGQLLTAIRELHRRQERELNDLADELHDSALAESKALEMHLNMLLHDCDQKIEQAAWKKELARVYEHSRLHYLTLRGMVDEVKPVDFNAEGLMEALQRTIAQINLLDDHTIYQLDDDDAVEDCSIEVKQELYGIIRAALHNVRDHAEAGRCWVRISVINDLLIAIIQDNGRGLQLPSMPQNTPYRSIGLSAMRIRAERLGGTLTVTSNGGTQIEVTIPLVLNEDEELFDARHDH